MALLSLLEIKLFLCASLWSRSRYFIALELGNHFSKLLLSPASLRNGIGLSLWACLLPSFYFLPALLLSFELGNLGFYFPAIFFFINFFKGEGGVLSCFVSHFASKKRFAFYPISSSPNLIIVVTECNC